MPARFPSTVRRRNCASHSDPSVRGSPVRRPQGRGSLAPIRRIIIDSRWPAEVQQRILALYADWSPDRVQPLIDAALISHAANGAVINAR